MKFRMAGLTRAQVFSAIAGAIISIAVMAFAVKKLADVITSHAIQQGAESYVSILAETQRYYAAEIVKPLMANGLKPSVDYAENKGSIPYPATFTHGLVDYLSSRHPEGTKFRFYSEYPFYDRANSGPQDPFEKEALAAFYQDRELTQFSRVESKDGTEQLRYAKPLIMAEGCVSCHNSHRLSPKKDWKVGDLRGVIAISKPVNVMASGNAGAMQNWIIAIWVFLSLTVCGLIASIVVVTKRKNEVSLLSLANERLANLDPVCDVANRRRFLALTDDRLNSVSDRPPCLIMLDLRGFKTVNDVHGHAAGDELLRMVAQRLQALCPKHGLVARIGGDEFAMLIGHEDDGTLLQFGAAIIDRLSEPYSIAGRLVHVSAAAGIARGIEHGDDAAELMTNADLAMYQARHNERHRVELFDRQLLEQASASEILAEEVRKGIERSEFCFHYQPQFNLANGRLTGVEALVRWNSPLRGLVPPSDFLPIAEEKTLMVRLAQNLINRVIDDWHAWSASGLVIPRVSLNMHAHQLRDSEHLNWFQERLAEAGIKTSDILLEVTEGCVLGRGSEGVIDTLAKLDEAGFQISLDDFGTGFASLSHIKDLPVSEVKIDRSFVRNLLDDRGDRAIVSSLIAIGSALEIRVVAEGIENVRQAALLARMGCPEVQGFLFGKPVPAAHIGQFVKDKTPAETAA